MRIGILFSGGKDSVNTLWYYLEQGWDVACLLSMLSADEDSWMFQQTSRELLSTQAEALGIPILLQETRGEKEAELIDLKTLLVRAKEEFGIVGVGVGALASDYQHERVTRTCHEVGLKTYAPLWHKDQELLLRELIAAGFDIRMCRIAADGLDATWLGRTLTPHDVDRLVALKHRVGLHMGGEGGEFETIVLDGPIFHRRAVVEGVVAMETATRGEFRLSSIVSDTKPI